MTDDELKSAIEFNNRRKLPETLAPAQFARVVQAAQAARELDDDGMYGDDTRYEFGSRTPLIDQDFAKIFAGGVHPMPIYGGVKPRITSGFITKAGRGPNKYRLKYTGKPHYGGDLGYWWNGKGEPPLGWHGYHFTARNEQLFYCPPVEVRAILDGEVEEVGASSVRIYHGELEGFGHLSTWSTHHHRVLVTRGQTVDAGTPVAIAGDVRTEGAPHNHQEGWRWQTGEQFTREAHALDLALILPHLKMVEA